MRPSERVSQISSLPCRILLIACVLECSMQQWQSSNTQASRHVFWGNQAHKYHSSCRHTAPSDEHHRGAYRTPMTQGYTQTPVNDPLGDIDCHWLGCASIYLRVASPTCTVDRHLDGLRAGQAEMQPVVILSFNTKPRISPSRCAVISTGFAVSCQKDYSLCTTRSDQSPTLDPEAPHRRVGHSMLMQLRYPLQLKS